MRGWWRGGVCATALLALVACSGVALADDDDDGPSLLDSVPALAPIKNARDALAEKGVRFSGFYFSDPRANLKGGMRRGATYSGLLNVAVDVDAEKVVGIEGGHLHANMFQIHGRDVSDEYVGNLLSANDIGARPTTRLFELWYEQRFSKQFAVKIGQMAADEEFLKSEYGGLFIDATFGWAGPPSENLPQGGPAYPLATPGVQLQFDPNENVTFVATLYNGTPARPNAADAEKANKHGLNFRVGDPPLLIVEGRFKYNQSEDAWGLPGMLKLGAYHHFGKFDDLRYGTDGLVLGSPGSNDEPRTHRGDTNFYAIVDQQIWKLPGADDDDVFEKGIGVFGRVIAGQSDRNSFNWYVDGGVVASGLIASRPSDKFGVAVAYGNFSPALSDADRAANAAAGFFGAVHDYEAVIEVNYRAEIIPGLTVQPTFQYVMHPNGGVYESGPTTKRIPNAKIVGLTTIARF